MIFNTNTTSMLGTVDIPMDEAYANSYGAALALVESANNDYNMFRALLNIDAHEISISESASGYVLESELAALHEAAIGGIFNKIKELIKKFIAKIKAIFANFYARIRALFAKDKQLLKDYATKVRRKTGINNMKVKWRDSKIDIYVNMDKFIQDGSSAAADQVIKYMKKVSDELKGTTLQDDRDALTNMDPDGSKVVDAFYNDDPDKMWQDISVKVVKGFADIKGVSNASELKEELEDAIWDDSKASEKQLKDAKSGGSKMSIDTIISRLDNFDKQISKLSKSVTYMQTQFGKLLKDIDANAKELYKLSDAAGADKKYYAAKGANNTHIYYGKDDKGGFGDKVITGSTSKPTDSYPDKEFHTVKSANATLGKASNQLYKIVSIVSDATMTMYNCVLDSAKIEYAQTKAAFVKGITVSEKKLEESYATAIADVVMEEVDEIISNAFNQENPIEDLTSATDDLLGKGVSNDPDHLTYDPNKYTSDADMDDYEGTKSSNYVGTSESAFFSRFIY